MLSAGRRHGQRRRDEQRLEAESDGSGSRRYRYCAKSRPWLRAHPPTSGSRLSPDFRRRSPDRVDLSDSAIRIAARLRAAKDPEKRLIAFLGLTDEDGSSVAASQTAEALALMGLGRVVLVDGNLARAAAAPLARHSRNAGSARAPPWSGGTGRGRACGFSRQPLHRADSGGLQGNRNRREHHFSTHGRSDDPIRRAASKRLPIRCLRPRTRRSRRRRVAPCEPDGCRDHRRRARQAEPDPVARSAARTGSRRCRCPGSGVQRTASGLAWSIASRSLARPGVRFSFTIRPRMM